MNTEDKIRWLAEQAGWLLPDPGVQHGYPPGGLDCVALPDYEHSLDAIARDLLPLLRERDMQYNLYWNGHDHGFTIWDADGAEIGSAQYPTEPATAAFEAIFEALHGGTE